MIALIYLVLIALVVTNIGSDRSIEDFYKLSQNLEQDIDLINQKNQASYQELKEKTDQNSKELQFVYQKSQQIKSLVEDFFFSSNKFKNELKKKAGILEKERTPKKINLSKLRYLLSDSEFSNQIYQLEKKIMAFKNDFSDFYLHKEDKKRIEKLIQSDFFQSKNTTSLLGALSHLSKLQLDLKQEEAFLLRSLFFPILKNEIYKNTPKGVLSAQQLNILYRGVDNPLIGAISGIPLKDVSLKADGGKLLLKAPGKWTYRPGKAKEVVFSLIGKTYERKPFLEKINFRIKELPSPSCFLRGESSPKLPFSSLKNAKVSALIPGFEFPITILVKSFRIKIPQKPSIFCPGNYLSQEALKALEHLNAGEMFTIYDLETQLEKESEVKLRKIPPMQVLITN